MPSGSIASRFAVQRYRTRILVARISMGRLPTFQIVNLVLAIIGAWSVIYQVVKFLTPDNTTNLSIALAGASACIATFTLLWFRLTRRPQDLFRSAATSEDRAEKLRTLMTQGMSHDLAYENLARLYAPMVEQLRKSLPAGRLEWPTDSAGKQCLVLTLSPAPHQSLDEVITDIQGLQDPAWTARVSTFASQRQAYMATIRRSVSLSNRFGDEAGSNIVVAEISTTPQLTMSVNTASYGQIMRTCDSLVNEFAVFAYYAERSAFRKKPRPLSFSGNDLLKVLPWRREVHSWDSSSLILAPRHRASGVGVSLSLVDVRDNRPIVFAARRSSNVGTYPDVLHVIPSGMMNARGDLRHSLADLAALPRLTMMTEFLEECFDVTELSGHAVANAEKRVSQKLSELHLQDLEPAFTGLAVDLLNLRTDVCGVIDLTSHASIVDAFNLSWEYTHTERLHRIDIGSRTPTLNRTDFVQSGIGSVHLAASWLAPRRTPASGGS